MIFRSSLKCSADVRIDSHHLPGALYMIDVELNINLYNFC